VNDRELMAVMATIIYAGNRNKDGYWMTPAEAVNKASQILFEIEHRPSIERTKRQ
jgi:hypothetical protein